MSDLVAVVPEPEERERWDEPAFTRPEHMALYRDLVAQIEEDISVLPGMSTVVGLMIRKLVRDYVTGLAADQGVSAARVHERDARMMQTFRLLLDQANRADLEHALRTEFVVGLVQELMRVFDGEVEDKVLRTRLKELSSRAFVTYTASERGRVR